MHRAHRSIALALAALAGASGVRDARAQDPASTPPPAVSAAQAAADGIPQSGAWPQTVTDGDRSYLVFAPHFDTYAGTTVGMSHVVRRIVNGVPSPAPEDIGIMAVSAQAVPGAGEGELELSAFQVESLDLGGRPAPQTDMDALQHAIGGRAIQVTRRALVHDMQVENPRAATTPGLGDDVPDFLVARRRTALVGIDGEAHWRNIGDTGWRRVANTPFIVLQAQDGSFVVRLGSAHWMGSADMGQGYAPVAPPPDAVISALGNPPAPPAGAHPPAATDGAFTSTANGDLPDVRIVTEPTVLVAIHGEPILADVAPGVQMAVNAECPLLRTSQPDAWWTLASGRWFSAPRLDGSWSRVRPGNVPAAFVQLPDDRQFDAMKASVPGTPQASAAVTAAQETRTIQVSRATARCSATWRGNPLFTAVPGTLLRCSLNASQPVIECDRRWYCCDNAVWFSADDPQGPWALCDSLPDAIAQIPAASPAFQVTGVDIVGADDASVTFGYDPSYLGTCIDDGTVVYGTGWQAAPVDLGDGGWASLPQTYGMPAFFDPVTGTFAPPTEDSLQDTQPALQSEVLVSGWSGWGWCPGWTSAWAWGWRNPAWWTDWGSWWRNWNPYWNRWANARTIEQRQRDDRAAAELAERERRAEERQAAADEAQRQQAAADEADRRAQRQAERVSQEEQLREARAEEVRLRVMRAQQQRDAEQAQRDAIASNGPIAPRGSMEWWYQYYNDYSHGQLSRATGYQDPRYAPGRWGVPVGR